MRYAFLFAIILLLSCEMDNVIDPHLLIPTSAELQDKFDFELIAADSIRIYSRDNAEFFRPYFRSILVDYKNEGYQYQTIDTFEVKYEKIDDHYRMKFSCKCKIPEINNPFSNDHLEMQIRLFLDDRNYRSIPFNVYPYKFPYKTAEIFIRKSDIPNETSNTHFIDLDIDGKYLYYMTSPGGHQIFRYNTTTREKQYLMSTYSEFFTYHEGYLYTESLDMTHKSISKYNITSGIIELEIGRDVLTDSYIGGIDIYNGLLYVLHSDQNFLLSSFNLDGQFIETIPLPTYGFRMFIYQDIVYLTNFPYPIERFSLSERRLLMPVISPSENIYDIYIDHETLYFTLYRSYLICYMPLWDLEEAE